MNSPNRPATSLFVPSEARLLAAARRAGIKTVPLDQSADADFISSPGYARWMLFRTIQTGRPTTAADLEANAIKCASTAEYNLPKLQQIASSLAPTAELRYLFPLVKRGFRFSGQVKSRQFRGFKVYKSPPPHDPDIQQRRQEILQKLTSGPETPVSRFGTPPPASGIMSLEQRVHNAFERPKTVPRGVKNSHEDARNLPINYWWHHFFKCNHWTCRPIENLLEDDEITAEMLRLFPDRTGVCKDFYKVYRMRSLYNRGLLALQLGRVPPEHEQSYRYIRIYDREDPGNIYLSRVYVVGKKMRVLGEVQQDRTVIWGNDTEKKGKDRGLKLLREAERTKSLNREPEGTGLVTEEMTPELEAQIEARIKLAIANPWTRPGEELLTPPPAFGATSAPASAPVPIGPSGPTRPNVPLPPQPPPEDFA